MPGFWDGVRKAAMTGATRVAVQADVTVRRLELQRAIARQRRQIEERCLSIGGTVVANARTGTPPPPDTRDDIAAVAAAEAEIARLEQELTSLGQGAPLGPGLPPTAPACPNCGAHAVRGDRFCGQCGGALSPPGE